MFWCGESQYCDVLNLDVIPAVVLLGELTPPPAAGDAIVCEPNLQVVDQIAE